MITVIYAVVGADGCECENLEALFPDEQQAILYLKALEKEEDPDIYGDVAYASVKKLPIGEHIDCLANNVVYTPNRSPRQR